MKWIMLILLSLTLFACDDASTPSGNVSSSSMYASISAIDDGTTTSIITHLRTASNTQYPDIFLENGDALLASSIGSADDINQAELGSFGGAITINENIKPLQRRNLVINDFTQTTYDAPEYATTFLQTNIAGDKYYLSLERELYTSIRDVPITLPTPFSLTSTQSSNINRLDSLTVDWIPSSDGTDSMSFQTIWFCEDSLGTTGISGPPEIINDSGSLSISQPTLPDAACSITVVLYRQLVSSEPALSSGFGLGHITKGIQRRHLGFYSTP